MTGVVDRMPLRIRLVVASTLLLIVGLTVSGFVASATLRGYLVDRVDDQLADASRHYTGPGFGAPAPDGDARRGHDPDDVSPSELFAGYFDARGTLESARIPQFGPASGATPDLPHLTLAQVEARHGQPFTTGSQHGDMQWRVIARPTFNGAGSVLVAQSLSDVDQTVGRLQLLELLVGLGVVVVLAGAGYAVVRRSLRPLAEVEHTAAAIAAGDLTQRVPEAHPGTEVGRLFAALNGMLQQIERSFRVQQDSEQSARRSADQMRQFVADASHELRTPLTSIRGFAELFRQGAVEDEVELERVMKRIEDEASRMGVLVDDLLLLARLDQRRPLERRPVDLGELAADAVEDARMVAPGRRIELRLDNGVAPIVVGDELRLRQVLGNLVGNALTHTPTDAPISVAVYGRTEGTADLAVLEVADEGPGLAPEHRDRVFERFYRADPSRTRSAGGAGLGLAIVAGLAEAHGGRVEVESEPGHGATFRVLLPRSSASSTNFVR